MNLPQYISAVSLPEKTELEKIRLLAYFQNMTENTTSFSLDTILQELREIGYPVSNVSRVKGYLLKSKDFKKYGKENEYMITPAAKQKLQAEFGHMFNNVEEVISSNEVLDETLFLGKRGYLDKLIKQINNCYCNNVMMLVLFSCGGYLKYVLYLHMKNKGCKIKLKIVMVIMLC